MITNVATSNSRTRLAILLGTIAFAWLSTTSTQADDERPNVLWLTCEDISPNLGCYGDDYAITPNLDHLAKEGVRYTHAVGICGVCAVNRSCLITGMYSSTIGSQDMRSRIRLPDSIPTYSQLLRETGYYCTNNSKTDYNFPTPREAWDECSGKAHWRNRKPGQPFFAVFNYTGSHESQIWEKNHSRHAAKLSEDELHDPDKAPVPPFHPDVPEVRRDWANYHDNITALDHWIADRLKELGEAGLAENTIVFFYSDHGVGMPMCKKWVWDWGLRVPLIIRFPLKYRDLAPDRPGTVTDRLVSFVDFPPTLLSLVGVDVPEHMQGKAFLGDQARQPRRYAFAIRDRMAEWYETIRVVRDKQYQYHRNFMPHLSWAPFCSYTLTMPTAQVWTQLHEEGKLTPVQDRYFQPKPTEELYDPEADPHMIHNLADDPNCADVLRRMRQELHDWQLRTRDLGLMSEYEMHGRAEGSTQYEIGQSEDKYPLQRILPVAELAGERDANNLPKLLDLLDDDEPIVRWWATLGLVMLGQQARPAEPTLEECLADDSPLVRVAAAEGLYQLGHVDRARTALVEALVHPTPFVRLRAMNVLYRLGGDARPALPAIEKASTKGIYPADYLNRMVDYLPARLAE
ncbi:MAG: sulfatase-like hydrolase/transferase [Planctomycetes bacterium]|nr:sulfatase-like hydrolase/transferase [Planctomycetota bacterium]MBL7038473.1 sulfatase-like hydrolase/transferase [Pirellulaceae bacterium]